MKPQKQLDADTELLTIDSPLSVFWHLAGLATGLIVVSTWLALLAAMVAGWLGWQSWLFCTTPVFVWLIVLALPVLFHARRGAVAVVAALASTAEAWLYIGYLETSTPLAIEPAEIIRPLVVGGNYSLVEATPPDFTTPAAEPAPRPRLWKLPNGTTISQEKVEMFFNGIFINGFNRTDWVRHDLLSRDEYEGCMDILVSGGILIGRRQGHNGKLLVKTPEMIWESLTFESELK
jgi:hypothetical protein